MEHLLAQTCERIQTSLTALYGDQIEESQLYEFKIILAKLNNKCQNIRIKLLEEQKVLQNLLALIGDLESSFVNLKKTTTPKQVSFALSSDNISATPDSPLFPLQQSLLSDHVDANFSNDKISNNSSINSNNITTDNNGANITGTLSSLLLSNNSSNSPFVTGIFFDTISTEDYNQIPKYIKGRLTLEKINVTIESLNRLYLEKYNLMRQNPSKLAAEQRQKFYDWREMECEETEGLYFITEADVKNAKNSTFKLDPTGRAILSMLRHLGRLREIRSAGGIVRLAILNHH